ncbi:hypothetical protein [Maribacter thermophilus]|uniref:hypothetical protein n=1 Tax=Maribacter thermophilus TaxID=1197874 RepID=UPI0006416601|nr:hypothetical protein [Maribacter thermophilus]
MNGKFIFNVEYYKKGKPNGKRSLHVIADDYEEVLWTHLLKKLCEKVHGHDFLFGYLKEQDVVCNTTNSLRSNYTVRFRNGDGNVIAEYLIEMEVVGERIQDQADIP